MLGIDRLSVSSKNGKLIFYQLGPRLSDFSDLDAAVQQNSPVRNSSSKDMESQPSAASSDSADKVSGGEYSTSSYLSCSHALTHMDKSR